MTDAPLPPVAGDGCLVVLAVATLVLALICLLGLALMIVRHHNDQPPIIVVPPPAHVPGRLRYQPATLWRGSKRCPLIAARLRHRLTIAVLCLIWNFAPDDWPLRRWIGWLVIVALFATAFGMAGVQVSHRCAPPILTEACTPEELTQ